MFAAVGNQSYSELWAVTSGPRYLGCKTSLEVEEGLGLLLLRHEHLPIVLNGMDEFLAAPGVSVDVEKLCRCIIHTEPKNPRFLLGN
jgi:hypothetical protein